MNKVALLSGLFPAEGAVAEPRPSREEAEAAVRVLIRWAGDDPGREGLVDTPKRVVKAYEQLYAGYGQDPHQVLARVFEEVEGGVVGLSKLARVVDVFARRLQTQESMTAQIAESIDEALKPRGVAVLIAAEHMCMSMRGVQKQGARTLTTQFTGQFKDSPTVPLRFLTMVRHGKA